jgi:hypothetical protein
MTAYGMSRIAPVAAIVLLIPLLAAEPGSAQVVQPGLWGVNGTVESIARIRDRLYVGGSFTTVGPNTGGGVPVDRRTASPRTPFARVTGRVSAVVSDGGGGWFLGGHFTAVEGVPRLNLAHVLADGTVAPWNPHVQGVDGGVGLPSFEFRPAGVSALLLQGSTLYVGGRFTTVGGIERHNLAAFDVSTGTLTEWNPATDDEVECLALRSGTVYVGGVFHHVGGSKRNFIASVDARTGHVTPWNPDSEQRVRALAVDGRQVYAGGDFMAIGGEPRVAVAALDAMTGRATSWDAELGPSREGLPHSDWIWPFVSAVAVHGSTLYVGGNFDHAGVEPRLHLASFDKRTGEVTPFAPNPDAAVFTIVPVGSVVYAGGDWYHVGGVAMPHVASFDSRTGSPTSWSPRANGRVEVLAVDEGSVYVGGSFTSLGDWQLRNGLAALDLTTGRLADWDPHLDGFSALSITALGDTLYFAGAFRGVGGQTRGNIAAADARTGAVTSWYPGPFGPGGPLVRAQGDLICVMGHGTTPPYFAKLDPVTAVPAPFDAHLDGPPRDFVEVDGRIYLAGQFVHVGGEFQPYVAAIDASTGQLLPWNPQENPDHLVFPGISVLAARNNTIYMGGSFRATSYFPRNDLAAVDGTSGALLPWDPQPTGKDRYDATSVLALAVRGEEMWVGGDFEGIGGQPRRNLAVLDATTGTASSLELNPDGYVAAFLVSGDTVYVGGAFRSMGGMPQGGIAAVILPRDDSFAPTATPASWPAPVGLSLGPSRPSPLRSSGVIGFTLPTPGPVRLEVYDVRGRRVATLLDGEQRTAGSHEAPIRTAGWHAGIYFCRLEAAGLVATRKVIVANSSRP